MKIISSLLLLTAYLLFVNPAEAQICSGSLGDPVINITFGAGSNPGGALSAQLPNLGYFSQDCPNDGYYTIINSTNACFADSWHTVPSDHTPGDANGYMMLINASLNSGDFYVDTVKGLCSGTTYEFAAWVLNVLKTSACSGSGISPNLTFNIESASGAILGTFKTGNIFQTASPEWNQYGLFFTMPSAASNVVLRITNNAPGGCGNDLILDDITFRPCGPLVNATIAGAGSTTSTSLCEGDNTSLQLSAVISAGYNAPAYQWQLSTDDGILWKDILGANTTVYKRLPTGTGNYQYRLTVSEKGNIGLSNCRVASNVLIVKVNSLPISTATNDGPKCAGGMITLTAGGGITYAWTGPSGFTANGQSVTANNAPSTSKYFVLVTNTAGCAKKDSTIATAYARPVLKFTNSTPACVNSQVLFTDQSTAAAGQPIIKWKWNFGDGGTASSQNPTHIFSSANTYPVSLITETDKGCIDSVIQQVNIHYLPQPDFGLPEVCLTDPYATFTDSSVIGDNSASNFSHLWNFGDAGANASNPNTSTQKNPRHTYVSTGIYQVQLTVTSKDGCVNDTVKKFTVNGALPAAKFTVDTTGNRCSNRDVTITNNSSVNFGSVTRVEIYWDQNNPALKTTDELPAPGKKYSLQYPVFGNPATKDFQIKLVAYSGISCVNESSQTITLKASPQVIFNAIQPVCEGIDPFIITAAANVTGSAGTGIYSGSAISPNGLFDPLAAMPGQHIIRYTFVATNNCSSFAEQTIVVYQQPIVNAGPDRTVLEGGFITLNATASGNNLSYLWSPGIAIENTHVLTPKVYPVNDQTYLLTATSSDNCISTDGVFVTVLKTPIVPNVFSPNGDGINDTWIIRYLDSYPGVDILVFDRYGQQVYHNIGYNNPWDGNRNGKPLPIGTYYYIIDRKVTATRLTGSVTIIR
ncbi:hypothetical protein BH10BAC3_BH10BAC3_03230 [soil metagenome]